MTFLTSDVTLSDWTDDESDGEAKILVNNLFGRKQMNVANVFELDTIIQNLASLEPEIIKLTATPNPWIATVEMRKHNFTGMPIDISNSSDVTNAAQCLALSRHAQARQVAVLLLETLPYHT